MPTVTRRRILAAALVVSASIAAGVAVAQAGSPFIGNWIGQVEGLGEARIVVTGVKANGLAEGRMEFVLNSFKAEFADRNSPGPVPTSRAIVAGFKLTIDSALGGTYELTLSGNRLAGTYVRGTTFHGKAEFTKQ